MTRRAVLTGIGVMAPGEMGRKAFWKLISNGHTATAPIIFFDPARFRSQVAAECRFDAELAGVPESLAIHADRANQLAVAATIEALDDAQLADVAPNRVATVVGSAVGCTMALEQEYVRVSGAGAAWLVDQSRAGNWSHSHLVPSSIARDVARTARAQGPCRLISNGCTSGLDVFRHALDTIRDDEADVVVTGAADAPISPITVACFDAIRATTDRNDDPAHASRPFDLTRSGFVLAEGSAMIVVEEYEHAVRRGAPIYAELAGAASRANAFHMTGLRPDGREMGEAIRCALRYAGVPASEVDYVNAHGSGTKQNDRHETAAIKIALAEKAYATPVSSIKSMVGHSLGAIGSIEIAATALAMKTSFVPPTANLSVADPECDLDYVPNVGRSVPVDAAVSIGSGFGGFQTAVVLRGLERP